MGLLEGGERERGGVVEALGKELGGLAGLPEGGDAEGVAEEEDVGAGDD